MTLWLQKGHDVRLMPLKKKPRALRKDEMIRVRVTVEQKRLLSEAAHLYGLDVSTWLRVLGLREAGLARPVGDGTMATEQGSRKRKVRG